MIEKLYHIFYICFRLFKKLKKFNYFSIYINKINKLRINLFIKFFMKIFFSYKNLNTLNM